MSSIEQNLRVPSLPILLRIAEELQSTLDYLVSGKDKIPSDILAAINGDEELVPEEKKFLIDLIRIWRRYKKK
jgi:transcriptional regulator with XRE-family HTH domain